MKSAGSRISRCHSTNWRSQLTRWSSSAAPLPALLVFPVGGDALLGDAVHLLGADLDLEGDAAGADHGGVQGLVQVRPRDGDEVLDAAGDGVPLVVDDAERGVAVAHRVGDDAHAEQVVDFVDGDLLPVQLLIDRPGALDAALDAGRDLVPAELELDGRADLLEDLLAGLAAGLDDRDQLLELVGVQVAEGQVLQLAAQFAHAEAVGDGGVELEGLRGDALLAVARAGSPGCACCAAGRPA